MACDDRLPGMLRRLAAIRRSVSILLAIAVVATGCAVQPYRPEPPARPAGAVRAELIRLMPPGVTDRRGWARDIQTAFTAQHIRATTDHLCSAIAVIGQESTFEAEPAIANLGSIALAEIERRAAAAHVPVFMRDRALSIESEDGRSYRQRLQNVQTEKQLSGLFEQFIGMVPLGQTMLGGFNPVRTGGPMQVGVAFAQAHADDYPYPIERSIRDEVFTRRGGVYFGIAHLLGYSPGYPRAIYRYADYNAGRYASRNAAFQKAVSEVSGVELMRDGDLLAHPTYKLGETERATRRLGEALELGDADIHQALKQADSADFEQTGLYRRIFSLARARLGHDLPRAQLPDIELESPKFSRHLTTAWFARRVDSRHQACMQRSAPEPPTW